MEGTEAHQHPLLLLENCVGRYSTFLQVYHFTTGLLFHLDLRTYVQVE